MRQLSPIGEARYIELGSELMCICGDRQLLAGPYACNMPGCPSIGGMRAELRKLIADGKTNDEIRAAFVEKYGIKVLAAPPTEGFSITAWLTPPAAFAVGLFVIASYIRKHRVDERQNQPIDGYDQSRIDRELEKYSPKE